MDHAAAPQYDSIETVRTRAASLHHNVKIRSFELASQRIYSQLMRYEATPHACVDGVDEFVNAGVMPVFPASRDHLNGTFSFCASAGLAPARVRKSIADGCFQTFMEISRQQVAYEQARHENREREPEMLAAKSVSGLVRPIRVLSEAGPDRDSCPFFVSAGKTFECPFSGRSSTDKSEANRMRAIF